MTTTKKTSIRPRKRERRKKENKLSHQFSSFRVGDITFQSLNEEAGDVPISKVLRRIVEEYLAGKGLPVG